MARFTFLAGIFLAVTPVSADWLILTDGQRIQVNAIDIQERAVHVTTRAGKPWSIIRADVDVDATLAANRTARPLEVVSIPETAAITIEAPSPTPPRQPRRAPTPTPAPAPAPPPPRAPETVVERELAPPPPASDFVPQRDAPAYGYRFAVTLNGVQGADALSFTDTNQFELFKEPAQIDSVYSGARSQGFEIGAQFRIAGPLAVGASVQRFQNTRNATYAASLPHPFFFDQFREISGAASDLTYEESALHVDAMVTKTWGPLTIDAFGGPSWFETKTEVLVNVLYDEVFPFNEVLFRGVEGRVIENRPLGYNVGATATFRVASVFGVDFGVRYSDARSNLAVDDGREIELDVGGLSFGAGLRFLFP